MPGVRPRSAATASRGRRDASAKPNGGEEARDGVHWWMDQDQRDQLAQRRPVRDPGWKKIVICVSVCKLYVIVCKMKTENKKKKRAPGDCPRELKV